MDRVELQRESLRGDDGTLSERILRKVVKMNVSIDISGVIAELAAGNTTLYYLMATTCYGRAQH